MIKYKEDLLKIIEKYQKENNNKTFYAYGIGIIRSVNNKTLDVYFPIIETYKDNIYYLFKIFSSKEKPYFFIDQEKIIDFYKNIEIFCNSQDFNHQEMNEKSNILKLLFENLFNKYKEENRQNSKESYFTNKIVFFELNSKSKPVQSPIEAYFKLHLLSKCKVKPNELNLVNLFSQLENIVWTNKGPILPEDIEKERIKYYFSQEPLKVFYLDKIPHMLDYIVPKEKVRIASGSRVRLGAYLSKGTTIMPAGYVNFNAGTLGRAMIEGRISQGVIVRDNSDLGGGASIMGTLSGGNDHIISVGENCLIGANGGLGISLGKGCSVGAGVYLTAKTKVYLYNQDKIPIDLQGKEVAENENIVRAEQLSGRDFLLFYFNTENGQMISCPNKKMIELNKELH